MFLYQNARFILPALKTVQPQPNWQVAKNYMKISKLQLRAVPRKDFMSPHKLLSKPKIRIRKKGGPRSHQIHDTHTRDLEREPHLGKLVFKASTKSDFSFHLGAGQRETQPTFGEMVAGPWKGQQHVILFTIPQL